jgi:5'-3' exonuclease
MPAKNDKIALIDADTVAFAACLNVQTAGDVLGQEFYTDEEWQEIQENPQYDAEEGVLWDTCPIQALIKAEEKIKRILDKTGCQEVELHFTGGKENFRYDIASNYKANRTGRPPAGLRELKEALCKKYTGTIHTKYEADDAVVYTKNKDPEKYILCAIDKDVLNSVHGTHFNYYESALYNIEMKWVEVDRHTSLIWRYLQTLTGDTTDNIIGLKGIGPAKANKILAGCMSHAELWQAVCDAYKSKGRTKDEALLNMNLVDMGLLQDDGTIKLRTHKELLGD